MSTSVKLTSNVKSVRNAIVAVAMSLPCFVPPAAANDFTARKVMTELKAGERYSFVAGVVEGLAVARYMNDEKKPDGMNCIYDWFYDDKKTVDTIYAAFERYADYPPGSVIDVLAKQKCGE